MKRLSLLALISIGTALLTSCHELISDNLCLLSINLAMFDSQLKQEIPDGLKGYTYLIMQNGQIKYTRFHGYARSPQDGLQYWDEFQKMHVASISKTITTVATLRLLKMKGLDANELIYKYLPPDWQVGSNVQLLRFRDLMRHQTGFIDVMQLPSDKDLSTRYDTLKAMVANGASSWMMRRYSNAHHALLRIILPVLEDYPYTSAPIYDEANTARRYAQIVKQLVFDPLNIEAALLDDDPDAGVLAYSSASDPEGVFETFDYTMTAGGYGWVLSARDVAKFWAYLWHTDVLLDASQRQLMRQTEMGLWNSGDTITGRYYCKLGGWFKKDPDLESGLEHWLRSAAVEFRDGTAVVLFANSPSGRGLRDIIVTAYEKAYGCFSN